MSKGAGVGGRLGGCVSGGTSVLRGSNLSNLFRIAVVFLTTSQSAALLLGSGVGDFIGG